MLPIKRLYTFIYQTFLPVFFMTFGISLFIFIIQFIWQHIEKFVGKGLETSIILELFSYVALGFVPQVLPLALLLASLMTFGSMGERLELLAIKAAGVSLIKIMKPMIILVVFITLGSFLFQNNLTPILSVKANSLLFSIKRKTPELAIPEGSFYNDLPGYSIYVKDKDLKTHMLRGVIIYDTSKGFKNMAADVCDSAIMKVADSKDYLTLTMFNGERFSNVKEESGMTRSNTSGSPDEFVPFMTEMYETKEIIIPFKGDFERTDESAYSNSQLSKDLSKLQVSIDSLKYKLDSLNQIDRRNVASQSFVSHRKKDAYKDSIASVMESGAASSVAVNAVKILDIDSVFNSYTQAQKTEILSLASSEARSQASNHLAYFHIDIPKPMLQKNVRMHESFWHKMFALPFACIIFFFIGAPLGSIIRKGGLGIPVIISVLLFIVYYMVGNVGTKMVRDGVLPAWQGEWLSAAVLFPLGVFLTYKSMKESALFNTEVYGRYLRDFLKVKSSQNRNTTREPDLEEIIPLSALHVDEERIQSFREFDNNTLKDIVHNYVDYGFEKSEQHLALAVLKERNTYFFDVRVNNYDYDYSKKILNYFKENSLLFAIPLYIGSLLLFILSKIFGNLGFLSWTPILTLVAYVGFGIRSVIYILDFYKSMNQKSHAIECILCFFLYPIYFPSLYKRMSRDLENIKGLRF